MPPFETALPSACHAQQAGMPSSGGKGGGPKGEKNGAYRTGRYTAEAQAERLATRELLREPRWLIDLGE
jgi:hypothetical protein